MIAVCNGFPIGSLIQIGHLTFLEKLFTELWVSPKVATELDGVTRPGEESPRGLDVGAPVPSAC